ncbi:MAG: nuclear transport factor 2 family protein [Cyclobacteriaceae bacterium]|nr:nuclear transport factor 2 family protein [Cyclobacteriaceae bacterium]
MRYLKYTLLLFVFACKQPANTVSIEDLKKELEAVEQAFSDSSFKKGFYHAMLDFAADEIVLFEPGDTVIHRLDFIKEKVSKYPEGKRPPYTLTWKAEKVDVASSGDLGYTYGWYKSVRTDSLGKEKIQKGLYNSIWKKIDERWRLVMD